MTANVRKRIRSRPGNGEPSSVSSGSASAAASESAPRMPAQERKTAPRQLDTRRAIHFGAWSTAKTHAKRSSDHGEAHERRVAEQPRTGDVAERVDDDG